MKLRSILIILSLLVCLSTLVGGYIYLSSVHQSILKRAENDSTQWTKHIPSVAFTHVRNQRNVDKAFAGLKELADLETRIALFKLRAGQCFWITKSLAGSAGILLQGVAE